MSVANFSADDFEVVSDDTKFTVIASRRICPHDSADMADDVRNIYRYVIKMSIENNRLILAVDELIRNTKASIPVIHLMSMQVTYAAEDSFPIRIDNDNHLQNVTYCFEMPVGEHQFSRKHILRFSAKFVDNERAHVFDSIDYE